MSENKQCPKCKSKLPINSKFCLQCGSKIELSNNSEGVKRNKSMMDYEEIIEDDVYEEVANEKEYEEEYETGLEEDTYEEEDTAPTPKSKSNNTSMKNKFNTAGVNSNKVSLKNKNSQIMGAEDMGKVPLRYPHQKTQQSPKTPTPKIKTPASHPKMVSQPIYDPNYDHYYDDILPDVMDEVKRFPVEVAIKIAICATVVIGSILYCVYYVNI